jgi:putative DNA primase/helicase
MHDRVKITDRAKGRWKDILTALEVPAKCLQDRHGPCPMCGGKDRFRWDNKEGNGTFYCSQCGAGNGVRLLMLIHGWDFLQTARKIESVIGSAKVEQEKRRLTDAECRAALERRWDEAVPVQPGDPVSLYLRRRLGVDIAVPKVIRSGRHRPEMVTIVQAPDHVAATAHITLLTEAGEKAPTEKVRWLMRGQIAMGSAVRLSPAAPVMGIAEGIETAVSASLLTGMPVWSALNEGLLQQWEPPLIAEKVVVFGDNDRNFVGQAAAYALAKRLSLRKVPISCEVMIPVEPGDDWNDVLRKKNVNSQLTPSAA